MTFTHVGQAGFFLYFLVSYLFLIDFAFVCVVFIVVHVFR